MTRGVFVTGTDTGVGKTLVACALLHALAARGVRAAPMKPVAAGAQDDAGIAANADSLALIEAAGWKREDLADVTPVLLREAIAPHIAAQREGRCITMPPIRAAFDRLVARAGYVVVEGVGGFLVPLADGWDSAELARDLGLPVVLVVGLRLGCLNHSLLTARAVRATGLKLAGWIANGIDPRMPAVAENVASLAQRLESPLLGTLPHAQPPDPRLLASQLDVSALL